jgi:hypothetical protein
LILAANKFGPCLISSQGAGRVAVEMCDDSHTG